MVKISAQDVQFQFDRTKAIESMLYLAKRIPDPDIYGICKLLYLGDKTCLEKYGRFIFGESYCAMEQGATPSKAYDILKEATQDEVDGIKIEGNRVIPSRDANLDYLSEADIKCLDLTIKAYGHLANWAKGQYAHDEAWGEAWNQRGNRKSIPISAESIAQHLEGSDDLVDYLCNRDAA